MGNKEIILKSINNELVYYNKLTDVIYINDNQNKNNIYLNRTLSNKIYDTCIEVTTACNQNCLNCFSNSFPDGKMNFIDIDSIKQIINDRIKSRIRICITGGEPFLHPQINQILNIPNSFKDLNFVINSNGYLIMSDDILNCLINNEWLLAISIHGNQNHHNKYTGTNSHSTIISNLKILSQKIPLHIYCVIHRYIDKDDVDYLFWLRDYFKVNYLRFILPREFGRFDNYYNKEAINYILEKVKNDNRSGIKIDASNTEFISVSNTIDITH